MVGMENVVCFCQISKSCSSCLTFFNVIHSKNILKIFSHSPSKKFPFVIEMVKENPEEIKKWQFRASSPGRLGSLRILQATGQNTQLKKLTFL